MRHNKLIFLLIIVSIVVLLFITNNKNIIKSEKKYIILSDSVVYLKNNNTYIYSGNVEYKISNNSTDEFVLYADNLQYVVSNSYLYFKGNLKFETKYGIIQSENAELNINKKLIKFINAYITKKENDTDQIIYNYIYFNFQNKSITYKK